MQKEKIKETKKREPLPDSFESIAEAAAFWDSHDSSEYEDLMVDVDFEVNIKRRVYYVPVDETIFGSVREKAREKGLSAETLVNLLLQKHVG